jgi:hypothetical protein
VLVVGALHLSGTIGDGVGGLAQPLCQGASFVGHPSLVGARIEPDRSVSWRATDASLTDGTGLIRSAGPTRRGWLLGVGATTGRVDQRPDRGERPVEDRDRGRMLEGLDERVGLGPNRYPDHCPRRAVKSNGRSVVTRSAQHRRIGRSPSCRGRHRRGSGRHQAGKRRRTARDSIRGHGHTDFARGGRAGTNDDR